MTGGPDFRRIVEFKLIAFAIDQICGRQFWPLIDFIISGGEGGATPPLSRQRFDHLTPAVQHNKVLSKLVVLVPDIRTPAQHLLRHAQFL